MNDELAMCYTLKRTNMDPEPHGCAKDYYAEGDKEENIIKANSRFSKQNYERDVGDYRQRYVEKVNNDVSKDEVCHGSPPQPWMIAQRIYMLMEIHKT